MENVVTSRLFVVTKKEIKKEEADSVLKQYSYIGRNPSSG